MKDKRQVSPCKPIQTEAMNLKIILWWNSVFSREKASPNEIFFLWRKVFRIITFSEKWILSSTSIWQMTMHKKGWRKDANLGINTKHGCVFPTNDSPFVWYCKYQYYNYLINIPYCFVLVVIKLKISKCHWQKYLGKCSFAN